MILACPPHLYKLIHRCIEGFMRLFGKKKASKPLTNVLAGLSMRLATLEREMRSLRLEYLETYDKVNRMMARNAKRAALDNPKPPALPEELGDISRSDQITAEILERRKGNHA